MQPFEFSFDPPGRGRDLQVTIVVFILIKMINGASAWFSSEKAPRESL